MWNIQNIRDRLDWKYRSHLSRFLLVLLSGWITVLAFPHEGAYSLLSWVCMVPFVLSLHKAKRLERICLGLLYGCLYILPGHWMSIWTPISAKDWSFATSCFLICLFFSCYIIPFAIFSFIKPLLSKNPHFSIFKQSAFLTCIIAWFPTYFSVTPACLIHDQPLMYQTADFGGMAVVIFSVVFVNITVAEMIKFHRQTRRLIYTGVCLLIFIIFVTSYGYYRLEEYSQQKAAGDGRQIEIITVQTKIRPQEDLKSLIRQNSQQRYSAFEWSAYAIEKHPNANLIILPESSVDTTVFNRHEEFMQALSEFSIKYKKSILFNSAERVDDSTPAQYYNTSQLMRQDGTLGEKYRKNILTPVYENNPLDNYISIGTFQFVPGVEDTLIPFENAMLIPSICYEVHSPNFIRNRAKKGGNIIVHVGNFQSFGTGIIAFFDLAMIKLRAVENRVPIVRSCNWGYGAFIEANGSIVPSTFNPPNQRNAISSPLFIPNQRAPYTYTGDLFLYLLSLIVCIDLFLGYRARTFQVLVDRV